MNESLGDMMTTLPYQLKAYYDGGKLEYLIPGRFLNPEGVCYTLDQFMDLSTYDMIIGIVEALKLSVHDRLVVADIAMHSVPYDEDADPCVPDWLNPERLEIINVNTGEVVDSVDHQG